MVLSLGVSRSMFHQAEASLPKAIVRSGIVEKGVSSLVPNPQIALVHETFVESYESFDGYTETDSGNDITVAGSKITIDTMDRDETSSVKKSFGANYFGDFEHLITTKLVASTNGIGGCWAMSDGSFTLYDIRYTNKEGFMVAWNDRYLRLSVGSTETDDTGATQYALGTIRYLTIKREGTILTCEIYTDFLRTDLEETLTLTCDADAYEYIMGMCSYGASSGNPISCEVWNLLT